MTLAYYQLDVFADRPGQGNPLGVVLGATAWDTAAMQAFAAWTNLVETTFLLPPTQAGADYRARIFTPTREIPFAGHPSLGSAHAALESGFATLRAGCVVQECGAGLLPLRAQGEGEARRLFVRAPAARLVRHRDADPALAALLAGTQAGALGAALVEGGRRWWIAELADEAGVRRYTPDQAAIAALARRDDALGLCLFARCQGADYDLVVRAFPAGVGIAEDPASGAANGLIAGYIALCEPQSALARGYRVSQGREIGHDAQIDVAFDADAVWVGGPTRTVVRGELLWDGA
jgi:PhzF family phenazine biosynthesis protein